MDASTQVEAVREALGPVGVILPVSFTATPPVDVQREAARQLERAGYRAVWTNEVLGKDALVQLALLLASTQRLVFGTCIANIWVREPETMHAAAAQLAAGFPGRFVLGMGVGYPQQAASTGRKWGSPLATMRAYADRMASPTSPPAPDVAYPRVIGANGPKMLALAGEIADGALPAGQPPTHTAQARQVLGPAKLLIVAASMVVDSDRDPAPTQIADTARVHLAAGADHVILMQPRGTDFAAGVERFVRLAPALVGLS
jgi:probable F420-dependent oxidoreductase